MELIEGQTLRQPPPLSVAEVVRVARQMCAALGHACAHGLLYRDLKPNNALLTPARVVELTDFGLAVSSGSAPSVSPAGLAGTQRPQPGKPTPAGRPGVHGLA